MQYEKELCGMNEEEEKKNNSIFGRKKTRYKYRVVCWTTKENDESHMKP